MPDPLAAPEDVLPALELVLERARAYMAELDGPVRTPAADEAARSFVAELPEEGSGTLAAVRELLERGTEAHVRSGGPRFFHWVIGGSTPAPPAPGRPPPPSGPGASSTRTRAGGTQARSPRSWRRSPSPGYRSCSVCPPPGAAH